MGGYAAALLKSPAAKPMMRDRGAAGGATTKSVSKPSVEEKAAAVEVKKAEQQELKGKDASVVTAVTAPCWGPRR
jgi:hypothetical protein